MKPEDSILQQVHDFMNTTIEEIRKPLEGFELSTVGGYLKLVWHCKPQRHIKSASQKNK